ncbi:MAG: hypothetical protein NC201_00270 [Prevotella sp.]|nr:hypothetical protein [Bacteroides sp.]MCM1365662.1 hypothetical protein [Prevotella sp.]
MPGNAIKETTDITFTVNNELQEENLDKYVDGLYNAWRNSFRDFNGEEYERIFSDNVKSEIKKRNIKSNKEPIFSESLAEM